MPLTYGRCLASPGPVRTLPRHVWRCAPDGLATRRQLRALGLRPGGQGVQAEVFRPRYRRGPLVAYLYRVDLAKPVRPMTPAKYAALAKAMQARRTCPVCRTDAGYCIPASLGMCVPCAYPTGSETS
ncbi:RRQRL motif-containing zinc-binding protein [Streptomyces sp. PH10-H1]|uniref:RRQRL motif-containing zinc-binding protein n=1 Tax=Streptomyces sp. PH10-H1 TaxID=3046212 RepID=UPI0024B94305|nr:RRQRL motif-containing zinc-binding protein [Streptomyces sp. PH10-H1]MDJ0346266.1 RRQRL motif-containing zinc-binding protein [Streptomyces sp. PH10-H1]